MERSARFRRSRARAVREAAALANVEIPRSRSHGDVARATLNYDASLVSLGRESFVSSPPRVGREHRRRAPARRGRRCFTSTAITLTFRFMPMRAGVGEASRTEVMASWNTAGGESERRARACQQLLGERRLSGARDPCRACARFRRRDYTWQWPKSFVEINIARLQELGRVSPTRGRRMCCANSADAEADPNAWFTTPMFLEIVAQKR